MVPIRSGPSDDRPGRGSQYVAAREGNPRPSAWALVGVLAALLLISPAAAVTVTAADASACPGQAQRSGRMIYTGPRLFKCALDWTQRGPRGRLVNFWKYVGTVVRASIRPARQATTVDAHRY